jgi:hypothetical protein
LWLSWIEITASLRSDPTLYFRNYHSPLHLNAALMSNIVIDPSQVATDTADYVATHTWGNTTTSTRTIIIEAATSSVQ